MSPSVRVRGNATSAEVAAVLSALIRRPAAPAPDAYRRWRAVRRAALRDLRPAARPVDGPSSIR